MSKHLQLLSICDNKHIDWPFETTVDMKIILRKTESAYVDVKEIDMKTSSLVDVKTPITVDCKIIDVNTHISSVNVKICKKINYNSLLSIWK